MPCTLPPNLPLYIHGKVVKGFGRGSKELGIPTANYPEDVVDSYANSLGTGIYYGWASVNSGPIYKMVMSIGWNPFYKNQKKSMETHIINEFQEDFYGAELRVIVLGYLRPEKNYPSLETLIEAINKDIEDAKENLDKPELAKYTTDSFFSNTSTQQTQTMDDMPNSRSANGVSSNGY